MLFCLGYTYAKTQSSALQANVMKYNDKRAFLFASFSWVAQKPSKAGITVEAALVLPVFLFTLLWFPCSLVLMGKQVRTQYALEQSAMEIARFVPAGEEEFVELTVNYREEIPFFPKGKALWFQQKSRRRYWSGKEERVAYITRTGTVYHLYPDCPYIHHNPRAVAGSAIDKQQNGDGKRYMPCRICCKNGGQNEIVYITTEGEHYHSRETCSGICKEVIVIPISETGTRPLCSRCGER